MFKRIDKTTAEDPNVKFEVTVRMIEIYCEKLQDLLVQNSSQKGGKDLKIRQIAGQIMIPDAITEPVKNYKQIKAHMDRGDSNRAIGGTKMNATSSRAHTVVTINLKKITANPTPGKPPLTMEADLNLVDLAGSEKSDQAGTTGDRLKEGNAINQSLTSLGNVIEALADNCNLKPGQKKRFIPYRDSKLTQMLQEGLGGNSSTIMVCAIRPGRTYYDETNNTLVYADRAKKIKNKPVINESPQDKIIRELQEENEKLKKMMGTGGGTGGGNDPELEAKLKAAQEEMEANQRQLEEMQKSWQQKLAEAEDRDKDEEARLAEEQEARNSGRPQIMNLNEDGMLDRKIFFDLSKITTCNIGRKRHGEEAQPEIVLGGVGVQENHAVFETTDAGTLLKPLSEAALPHTFVNGKPLKDMKGVMLKPNDRIIIGTGSCFLFRNQDKADQAEIQDTPEKPITHEFAMKEKMELENAAEAERRAAEKAQQELETEMKMKALHDKMEAERKAQEEEQAKMIAEFEAKMKAM